MAKKNPAKPHAVEQEAIEVKEVKEEQVKQVIDEAIPHNKPFNPDEEALMFFYEMEELVKKAEALQLIALREMNIGSVPTSIVVTYNNLKQCYERMKIFFGR